jgi:hypothetical protein
MSRRKASPTSWAACKQVLRDWPRPGVVALVQELYKLSDDNRQFLHARLLPQQAGQTLDEARRKLKAMQSPEAVFHDEFSHRDLRRVIDQYAKAANDPAGVADLLLSDLEAGFQTFSEVGDFEPIVDHLYASLHRLHDMLETLDAPARLPLIDRLQILGSKWGSEFGYGISDELTGIAAHWREK